MLFRNEERVRYEGQGLEKIGLVSGMEGEVVSCYRESVEVFYYDLKRTVHHKDFDMKMCLKKVKKHLA